MPPSAELPGAKHSSSGRNLQHRLPIKFSRTSVSGAHVRLPQPDKLTVLREWWGSNGSGAHARDIAKNARFQFLLVEAVLH